MRAKQNPADNIVELPSVRGKVGLLAKLDLFLMNELTPAIGFERGTYALRLANYKYAGDIVAASPDELLQVEGMTAWKLSRITQFLHKHGLEFGMDVAEWKKYKSRNGDEARRTDNLRQPRFLRLVR